MNSNFAYLQEEWPKLFEYAHQAEKNAFPAPRISAFYARLCMEEFVRWLYDVDYSLRMPYNNNLSSLLTQQEFKDLFQNRNLYDDLHVIRRAGNDAAHSGQGSISDRQAFMVLKKLFRVLNWFARTYSEADVDIQEFDETLVQRTGPGEKSLKELKALQEKFEKHRAELDATRKALEESEAEKAKLQEELEMLRQRKEERANLPLPPEQGTEAETREFYIDSLLREAGWNPQAPNVQEYEVAPMPTSTNPSGKGYADYVLWGADGKPLAVVEAKKASRDPNSGRHQAELYASALEKMHKQRPVIFYTNGFETFIWDDQNYPPRAIQGFYTQDELQRLINRRKQQKSLKNRNPNRAIAGRYYQLEAIQRICEDFDNKHRSSLLVMATGTGKTRTAIALVDLMMKAGWIKRALFLADRNALVRQAKKNFGIHLKELTTLNLVEDKEDPQARMVFSTYPTMMNKIDGVKTEDERYYSVGHFDLIIIDEAHRSVYQKYGAIFDYFDSLLIGLTATPKQDVDHNTYQLFGRTEGDPTFAYELETAVNDKFLVPPKPIDVPTQFQRQGIRYNDLSEEEKERYEMTFRDEETGDLPGQIDASALNTWLFNEPTVDLVLSYLMTHGLKVEGGDKIGKSIIFAKNHRHAEFIKERFDLMFPHYRGQFAAVIDNYAEKAQDLIDKFGETTQLPQVAISVDMLDTGIDIEDIVNLVFFKAVHSSSKFWQMIGRGTRLCPDIFGPKQDKRYFNVFDFCQNFEFFRAFPQGTQASRQVSLSQRLFEARLRLTEVLSHADYQDEEHQNLRNDLLDKMHAAVNRLESDNFIVAKQKRWVIRFQDRERWENLSEQDMADLRGHVSHLILPEEEHEKIRRFDLLILNLQYAILTVDNRQERYIKNIREAADYLSSKANLPAIKPKLEIIKAVRKQEFWQDANPIVLERVRENLRELMTFIEKEKQEILYTHFQDELGEAQEVELDYRSNDLESYRTRVARYVRENENLLTIRKLKTNEAITAHELETLEKMLFDGDERGTKEEFQKEVGEKPLGTFIRSILGLDINAAKAAFADFLAGNGFSADQMTFINTLINHLAQNGTVDPAMLVEPPFTDVNHEGIFGVFEDDQIQKIVSILEQVDQNADAA